MGHQVRGKALLLALLAFAAAEHAVAQRTHARLTVEAVVVASCTVTTAHSASDAAACSGGERPQVQLGPAAEPVPPVRSNGSEAAATGAAKVITLTY